MKNTRIFCRVSDSERQLIEKAGREHKSISAFLLWSVRTVWKYRKLIEQAQRIEREYDIRNMKAPAMMVAEVVSKKMKGEI
jgi:uncharacterized protein (DUF1778 family)